MPAFIDRTGDRYGRLTVVSQGSSRRGVFHWLCRCDCGATKEIAAASLKKGSTRSCGCLSAEVNAARNEQIFTTHGMTDSPEYNSWRSMKKRCLVPTAPDFDDYGGRGITVCDRWVDSFEAFYADMGPRPEGMTLDRIDNNGNYEQGNCRWADAKTQSNNRRAKRMVK